MGAVCLGAVLMGAIWLPLKCDGIDYLCPIRSGLDRSGASGSGLGGSGVGRSGLGSGHGVGT